MKPGKRACQGRRYKECRILGSQSNIKGEIERERWCVGEVVPTLMPWHAEWDWRLKEGEYLIAG